jgi:hypothetical protein
LRKGQYPVLFFSFESPPYFLTARKARATHEKREPVVRALRVSKKLFENSKNKG